MPRTYLFYDIETTGLNKAFDQVIQFAAIRTDLELKEIERVDMNIKLNNDVVPSPQAFLTHEITLAELDAGLNEYEAINKIHALFNQPGTISIGYNSLGFDDEFLRFAFYHNLLSPYTHQYANDCRRMDLYPMATYYYLYKPEIVNWPEKEGKPSLKLELINAANHFVAGKAHNAMIDVEVTLAFAQRLRQEQKMWDYLCGYFDKAIEQQRISQLPIAFTSALGRHYHGLYIEGVIGTQNYYQCPVIMLGQHRHYKNQTIWLRLDSPELMQANANNIKETTRSIMKKSAEPGFILPPKARFMHYLGDERFHLMEQNLQWLQANPELLAQIADYYLDYTYPKVANIDVDAVLYQNGFISDYDQKICRSFQQAEIADKVKILDRFHSKALREIGIRILGRHYPHCLPQTLTDEYHEHLQQVFKPTQDIATYDYRGELRLQPQQALQDITNLEYKNDLSASQQTILQELKQHITKQSSNVL